MILHNEKRFSVEKFSIMAIMAKLKYFKSPVKVRAYEDDLLYRQSCLHSVAHFLGSFPKRNQRIRALYFPTFFYFQFLYFYLMYDKSRDKL